MAQAPNQRGGGRGGDRPPRRGRGGEGGEREGARRRDRGDGGNRGERGSREEQELVDKLVNINRVAKVVKGGRRFGFAALVVVGDGRGRVGYGSGKAREVPEAIRKATESAKSKLIRVPLREGRTLHHDVKGHFGAGHVTLRAAPESSSVVRRAALESITVPDEKRPIGRRRGCGPRVDGRPARLPSLIMAEPSGRRSASPATSACGFVGPSGAS